MKNSTQRIERATMSHRGQYKKTNLIFKLFLGVILVSIPPGLISAILVLQSGCNYIKSIPTPLQVLKSYTRDLEQTIRDAERDRCYIVIRESDKVIADVWIVENSNIDRPFSHRQPGGLFSMSANVPDTTSWQFLDKNGNMITVENNCKIIKASSKQDKESMLAKYHEYHREFETVPYEKLYAKN
jgi:hypothetical protein